MSHYHPLRRRSLFSRILPLLLFPAIVTGATAQLSPVPLSLAEELGHAGSLSQSIFSSDAVLTLVSGVGGGSSEPAAASIDFQSGSAAMWSYTYYSPSKAETYTIDISKTGPANYQVVFPGPLPAMGTETAIDLTKQFAQMSTLPDRLATDDIYALYNATYPTLTPASITLGGTAYIGLPPTFPKEQKQWQIGWSTATGDRLNCVVAVETGEVFCARTIEVTIAGVRGAGDRKGGSASLTASPNPASGRVRIDVHPRSDGSSGPAREIALYDARGSRVRDLTPGYAQDGASFVEIETAGLTPGLYICRASGDGWSEAIGVMVGR